MGGSSPEISADAKGCPSFCQENAFWSFLSFSMRKSAKARDDMRKPVQEVDWVYFAVRFLSFCGRCGRKGRLQQGMEER